MSFILIIDVFSFSLSLVEWQKLQKYFLRLSTNDTLERLREGNLMSNEPQPECSSETRSVSNEEKDSLEKDTDTKIDEKKESIHENKDRLIISNIIQKSKTEKQVIKKTQDTIKMAYTAFTCHDESAYEKSIVDLKSTSSEISGIILDKKTTTSTKTEQHQKCIEINRKYIGDTPVELQENIQNNSSFTLDTPIRDVILQEAEEIDSTSEEQIGEKTQSENKREVKTGPSLFSNGKKLIQTFMRWGFNMYEISSYEYELTSPKNHMNALSKHLTE